MRPTLLTLIAGAAMVLCACSSGTPTQAPGVATQAPGQTADAGGGGGSGSTQEPEATTDSGGGGGGGAGSTANGSVHIELSGPATQSGDYGLVLPASRFGGPTESSFSFTNADTTAVVTITTTADGKLVVSYGTADFTAPGAECTGSNMNIGASSASGSFECHDVLVVTAAGASLLGGTLKGTFTAHT
jgi:hypothetical protein